MVTHTFKAKADTHKKREPPTHTQHNNRQLNRATRAQTRKQRQHTASPQKQQDRQSKTEHKQDAGPQADRKANNISPNSRIKNQGLACKHQGKKKEKQTNKQHVPATHLSYQSKNNTERTTERKTKARPRREKGERGDPPRQERDSHRPPPAD